MPSADNAQNLFQLRLQSISDKLINALRHEGSAEWNNLTEPAGTHAVYSINLLVNVRIFCSPLCTSNSDSSIPLHHTVFCSTTLTLVLVLALVFSSAFGYFYGIYCWGWFGGLFSWPFSPQLSSTHAKQRPSKPHQAFPHCPVAGRGALYMQSVNQAVSEGAA